jgi:hypothetical protein
LLEAEWFTSVNGARMIEVVREKGSDRIWRLLAVACVRRVESQLRDPRSRKALDVAERFADGTATIDELSAARALAESAAHQASRDEWEDEVRAKFQIDAAYEAVCAAKKAARAALICVNPIVAWDSIPDGLLLPDLIREIFGAPFQWVTFDPSCLSGDNTAVKSLAAEIYDRRTFDRFPDLANALEHRGCHESSILGHLRSPGPHVRGCWALDLILGKS